MKDSPVKRDSPWRPVDVVAYVLVLVGAINWGLVGFFDFNLVAWLFGETSTISRIIYALVGLAGIYGIVALPGMLRRWAVRAPAETAVREREHMHV
jgi:uncharacterized membrane protein YuzA (DUF378 family)